MLWMVLLGVVALAAGHDLKLVRDALARRPEAVRELVDRLLPVIRSVVGWRLRDRRHQADVDDYAQEVWIALLARGGRKLLAYDPARGATFEGYVGLVTDRELADRLRQERAQKRGGDQHRQDPEALERVAANVPDPERQVAARDQATRLRAHLDATLPERGRLVFRFLYLDGRSVAETAAALGVNTQVVYNWQHRIRKEARSVL